MLSKYVGEEKFLKGVSLYLKKHLYSNTVSRDLWEGIGEATGTHIRICAVSIVEGCTEGLDVPRIMDHWVSKVRGRARWVMK
jgi:aminopeptidase 2